jgi:tetratricopeptide (TPR) repeat protein
MVQWIHGYSLFPDDLRMVVRTFRTVFPATSVWNTTRGDFLLLGRTDPAPLDLTLVEGRFPRIRPDLLGLGIRAWPGVLGYFMLGEDDARRFSESAGLNTDDRLPLEFSAPRALHLDTATSNWQLVHNFKVAELPDVTPASKDALDRPDVRYWIGAAYLSRHMPEDALSHFQRALQLDPEHTRSLLGASRVYLGLRRPAEALGFSKKVIAREPLNADAFFLAGLASRALNATTDAAAFLEQATTLEPQNAEFRRALDNTAERSVLPPQSTWASGAMPSAPLR